MKVTIHTDGSSRGNPGPGGWGAILVVESSGQSAVGSEYENRDEVIELGGSEDNTTNNRMELMGAIMGLKEVGKGVGVVEVCTDSQYVKKGMSEWITGWIKKGWIGSTKKPVMNKDLWELLKAEEERLIALGTAIKWTYVPGHAGVPLNERADVIATACADSVKERGATNLELYRGPKADYEYL
jgi:ribonuclease HI